jgi:hypothetical protein
MDVLDAADEPGVVTSNRQKVNRIHPGFFLKRCLCRLHETTRASLSLSAAAMEHGWWVD